MTNASCKKKDRLSASTYGFEVIPRAATVVKGQTQVFTARGVSPNGSAFDANPVWSVSPASVGDLNTSLGPTVTFTANALGDVTISAIFDGTMTQSKVAVVTYKPNSNTYDVYNDNGLPTGIGQSDIFTSVGLDLDEISSGYTPERIKYQRATSAPDDAFWGVTLDKRMAPTYFEDLSSFSGGALHFTIRLNRVVNDTPVEVINIDVRDTGAAASVALTPAVGFARTSLDWQEISIPLSNFFSGINETQVRVPFAIVLFTLTSPLTFDVDAVRWEK